VDGAEVGVLEQPDEVRLGSLLQRGDGRALEPEVGLEVLRDLADQALEGELADQQLRALLVLADLAERHGAGAEAVGGFWKRWSLHRTQTTLSSFSLCFLEMLLVCYCTMDVKLCSVISFIAKKV
jgi:hypothetical protein